MNWIREIKAVGFRNWFWFVFILKRNEFSQKLDMLSYLNKTATMEDAFKLCGIERRKAHEIDMILKDK